jgi:hypothetical protein
MLSINLSAQNASYSIPTSYMCKKNEKEVVVQRTGIYMLELKDSKSG